MYRELDDNELLYMINDSTDNYDYLLLKYKPLIFNICKNYESAGKALGYELEDLMQIAFLGLFNAIKTYKEQKNVLFYTYMISCVKNSLKNELRNQLTNKKTVLNIAIPYDEVCLGYCKPIIEIIPDKNSPDPLQILLEEMGEIAYINFLNSLPFEVAITYEMKSQLFNEKDIANFLETDEKKVRKYLRDAKKALEVARLDFKTIN